MGEFGEKFRKARETRNLTLDDVSKVTKISPRMLQAIEEQKFDVLPGGVFNKGFIRAYAKHLGINDEEAVTEYLDCLRQAQIAAQAVWEPPSREAVPPNRPIPTSRSSTSPRSKVRSALHHRRSMSPPSACLRNPTRANGGHQGWRQTDCRPREDLCLCL